MIYVIVGLIIIIIFIIGNNSERQVCFMTFIATFVLSFTIYINLELKNKTEYILKTHRAVELTLRNDVFDNFFYFHLESVINDINKEIEIHKKAMENVWLTGLFNYSKEVAELPLLKPYSASYN